MIGLTTVILAGCQKQDEVTVVPVPEPVPEEPARDYVLVDLALSLPSASSGTRMAESVTQEDNNFRDISKLSIVPFFTHDKVTLTDLPMHFEIGNIKQDFRALGTSEQYRIYEKFYLKHGVASFLTYGQASWTKPENLSGIADKAFYGSLRATIGGTTTDGIPDEAELTPANLSFELDPIYNTINTSEATGKAQAIGDYLTYIADTPDWKTTGDVSLQTLYKNFISYDDGMDEYGVIAGSSANVVGYVNRLYQDMNAKKTVDAYTTDPAFRAIVDGVLTRITDYTSDQLTLTLDGTTVTRLGTCDNYPGSYGLPDGAAVLRFVQKEDGTWGFVPQRESTSAVPISGMTRYAYPPELYYYGNSRIKTSNEEVLPSAYTGSWENSVSTLYDDGDAVSNNTQAVAIVDPMDYAVAQLKATVKANATLKDAANPATEITVGENTFPITGLIVSGQHPVGFDFRPETTDDGTDRECFVYDRYLPTSEGSLYLKSTESKAFRTLLLQTKEKENVTLILEVENKSGQDFMGKNGIVFKDTKFYLVGKVQPLTPTEEDDAETLDLKKRVFTQDHTTTMGLSVQTLKNAYNVMPNIQSGRLEVSVEVQIKWYQADDPYSFQFEE